MILMLKEASNFGSRQFWPKLLPQCFHLDLCPPCFVSVQLSCCSMALQRLQRLQRSVRFAARVNTNSLSPVCNSNFPRGACKYSCYGDSVSGYPAYTWCQKGFMSAHYCPSTPSKNCCHSCQRLRSGFEAVNSTEVRSGFSVEQELRTSENVSQIEAKDKTATENKENGELPGNATSLPSLRGMRMP